ncbi:MAG: response regulator transcription factor [bacterium]
MTTKKILAVDDDPELLEFLKETLINAGFSVVTAETGKSAMTQLKTANPDMLLLDLMLPDFDGLEICRRVRSDPQFSKIPIIMLTARKTVEDKVIGLDQGADVYFPKPFESKELVAQIRSTFRRLEISSNIMRRGAFELNPRYNQIKFKTKEITGLSSREYNTLYALMEAAPNPVPRGDLYKRIWDDEGDYPDTTRRIDMMVQRLRSKIGEEASSHIKTVEGVGYKFEE